MPRPKYRWMVTPNYFETHEMALLDVAPDDAVVNGPHDIPDRSPDSMAQLHQPIYDFVQECLYDRQIPISLAGDCCAAIPVACALQAKVPGLTLVWVDAHGDFNTPETSPSQFLGGMPLAMLTGRGPQEMCSRFDLWHFHDKNVWLIDGRDLDPLEKEALENSGIRRTGIKGMETLHLYDHNNKPIHLHIDLDVINSDEAPAMNYPVKGGPSVDEVAEACRVFCSINDIAGISICGWTGKLDEDGRTAAAAKRILDELII